MGVNQNVKEKQRRNRQSQSKEEQFKRAQAISAQFALSIYEYFHGLPGVVNVETNLDYGPTQFFEILDTTPSWFGNTICFDLEGNSFRLYFAFQFNPELPTINDWIIKGGHLNGWPGDVEPRGVYKFISNFWIQLNMGKSYDPNDGEHCKFLVRFDAEPDWKKIQIFPLHKHLYEENLDKDAIPFSGTRDELIEELQRIIENELFLDTHSTKF